MRRILFAFFFFFSVVGYAVKIGDSRADVIAELGEPQSTLAGGQQEFLNYAGGRVILIGGQVAEIRGTVTAAPTPTEVKSSAPVAVAPVSTPSSPVTPPSGHWYTDIDEAMAAADEADKRVLALFTGSDWCPPCQKFEAEVAHDEQFVSTFSPDFIFFKCDWLRNTPQSPSVAAEVKRLLQKYDISQYPTLKVLDSLGEELDEVDWTSVRGGTLKEAMIAAIDESRKATTGGKKAASSWWPF